MVPPIILVGLALLLWRCTSNTTPPNDQNDPRDAGYEGGGDAGNQTMDAGTVCSLPQTPPPAIRKSEMPCAFPASLGYEPSTDSFITACTYPKTLFRSGPSSNLSGPWQKIADIDGVPTHHMELPNGFISVSHSSSNGVSVINSSTGETTSHVILSGLIFQGPSQPAFDLTFPSGMVYSAGKFCMATSNIASFGIELEDTVFNPGTLACFSYNSATGVIDPNSAAVHMTSGINPTGVAQLKDGRIAVLSSNDYRADKPLAAIDLFTPPQMARGSLNLGTVTAQPSPTLATTLNEEIIFGLQRPSNGVRLTNVAGTSGWTNNLNGAIQGFISNVSVVGNIAAMSDFGVFGSGGQILFLNLAEPSNTPFITRVAEGQPGPAASIGKKLYIAATKTDASSADLYEVDLTNYECEK